MNKRNNLVTLISVIVLSSIGLICNNKASASVIDDNNVETETKFVNTNQNKINTTTNAITKVGKDNSTTNTENDNGISNKNSNYAEKSVEQNSNTVNTKNDNGVNNKNSNYIKKSVEQNNNAINTKNNDSIDHKENNNETDSSFIIDKNKKDIFLNQNQILSSKYVSINHWYKNDDGNWEYFDSYGNKASNGWKQIGNKWYYFYENGELATDTEVTVDDSSSPYYGKSYFVDSNGRYLQNQWHRYEGDWYYVKGDGSAIKGEGWHSVNNTAYYFYENGELATDTEVTVDDSSSPYYGKSYFVDSNGRYLRNQWHRYEGDWYYVKGDGSAIKGEGWHSVNNTAYYFYENGELATDTMITDDQGNKYLLDSNGHYFHDGAVHYYEGDNYYIGYDGIVRD